MSLDEQLIQTVLDDHVIYGTWDDTTDNQFLVHYHPNGIHCTVFTFGGMDYGGGIRSVVKMKSDALEALFATCKSVYDFKREIDRLAELQPENQPKEE